MGRSPSIFGSLATHHASARLDELPKACALENDGASSIHEFHDVRSLLIGFADASDDVTEVTNLWRLKCLAAHAYLGTNELFEDTVTCMTFHEPTP